MNRSRLLKLGILVFAVALLVPGLALAQGGGGNTINNQTRFNPQPILIWTVSSSSINSGTGGTGGGTGNLVLETLIVYNNGLSIWATSSGGTGSGGSNNGGDADVQTAQLTGTQINDLIRQFRQAGFFRNSGNINQNNLEDDAVINTVTVFFGPGSGNRNLSQTFSFVSGDNTGNRGRVSNVLTNFLNTNFGGGSGGGSGQ